MHRMIRLLYLVLSAHAMILSAGVPFPAEAAEPRRTTVFERAEFLLSDDRLPPGDASAWAPVDLPDQWRYTRPNYSGWGWYRIKFHLAQIPAVAQGFNVSHRRSHNFSVFINGVLIGSALDVISGGGTGFGTPVYLNIPPSMLRAGENTFHIRMHATSSPVVMHGLGRVIFGDGRLVRRGHVAKLELGFYAERAFMIMALVIGVIALFLWFARRSDRVMFWFSVTCLSWALVGVPRHTLRWLDLALLNNVLNIVVRYGLVVPSIILCLRIVGLRSPKIEAGLWAFFLVEIAYPIWSGLGIRVTILDWDLMNAALVLGGIAVIFFLEKGPFRWLHRLEIAALSLMATFLGFEIARYLGWVDVESPVYRQFHVPVMLLALGAAIFDRHVVAIWRMEQTNAELEQRVAEKAREIEAYHSEREEVLRQKTLARERQRIVADMHDGLGASLVGLLRYVQAKQADPHIEQRVKEALQEMRIAIDALEPAEGDLASVLGNLRYRQEVRVRQVEGGGDQARHVDLRAGAEQNTAGVDEEDAPVRLQRSENGGRILGRDAVQDRARSRLLEKSRDLARANGEALPVDDGVGRIGDLQDVSHRHDADGAVDHRRAGRIGEHDGGSEAGSHRCRYQVDAETCRPVSVSHIASWKWNCCLRDAATNDLYLPWLSR